MACPHVSGGAAFILEADPTKKSSAVIQKLLNTPYLNVVSDFKAGDTNAFLCVAEGGAPPTPTPQPTPAPPPGTWVISRSGCELDSNCIQSLNHPSNYDYNQQCSVELFGNIDVGFQAFNTERRYDVLMAGGSSYSGASGPAHGAYTVTITWSSDYSFAKSGWRICRSDGAGSPPTPSPTPSPPAPPSPPATSPTPGNCSSWCEPPADCVDYPYSSSG